MHRTQLVILALLTCSCGPAGPLSSNSADDYGEVFLYLINAYPGAAEMKVKESRGTLAKSVGFGERAGADGLCPPTAQNCLPTFADRTDGIFHTKFDGEGGKVDLRDELRAMYPQETATAVFTGPDRAILLRHPQTISSGCGLDIVNALAVEDHASEDARFDLAVEFRRAPAEAGFLDEAATPFVGPCGELPTDAPEHEQLIAERVEALASMSDTPWFLPVACENGEPGTCFVWGLPTVDGRTQLGSDGTAQAMRDTASYVECVENAFTRTGACSATPSWADISFDARDVQACTDPLVVRTRVVAPQSVARFEGESLCEVTFRTRTVGRDLVFGPRGGDTTGRYGDGELIQSTVETPQGSDHFWVLYGRPVNPRVWQWDASDTFVDLGFFPYPE